MNRIVYLALVAICVAASHGRHVHPKLGSDPQVGKLEEVSTERVAGNDLAVPDLTKIKVGWFVPVNNRFFFKSEDLCEPGYKRDVSGICREVWD